MIRVSTVEDFWTRTADAMDRIATAFEINARVVNPVPAVDPVSRRPGKRTLDKKGMDKAREWIKQQGITTVEEMSKGMGITQGAACQRLRKLVAQGLAFRKRPGVYVEKWQDPGQVAP